MTQSSYFAIVAPGLEEPAAEELKNLGATSIEIQRAGIKFSATTENFYRILLWVRIPTKLYHPIREFSAAHPAMLYDQIKRMKWDQYFTHPDMTLAISCTIGGGKDEGEDLEQKPKYLKSISHSHFAALKIKDAIVDRLRELKGWRPNVDTEQPDLRIHAHLQNKKCTLSLEASAGSLHERGYRAGTMSVEAPLKETLASGLVALSGWAQDLNALKPLADPFCGSGTILIEAAAMACRIAPGLFQTDKGKRWGIYGWPDFNDGLWQKVLKQARNAKRKDVNVKLYGYDIDSKSIRIAKENARKLGVDHIIEFTQKPITEFSAPTKISGIIITNPPYGERLGEVEKLKNLYKEFGDRLKHHLKGWEAYLFTGNVELSKSVGLRTSKRIILFNGPIECRLLKYELY